MLHCESYSVGGLTIHQSWQRGTAAIQEDERVIVLSDGTLLVTAARVNQDSGTYNCVATNVYGTSIATSYITVLRKSDELRYNMSP